MLIGFDASRAFVKEATGTENYSLNLLKALAKIDRKNRYRVYLRGTGFLASVIPNLIRDPELRELVSHKLGIDSRFRGNDKVRVKGFPPNFEFKVIRPYRLWTQVGLAWETWCNPVDLLFVPAHTLPILRKRKIGISNFQFPISNFPKYVVTIHDLGVEYLPNYHKFPQRYYLDLASKYAAKHADAIIAVSAATKSDLIKRYHAEGKKVFVVHEGVDMRFFRPSPQRKVNSVRSKYKIDGRYILFVGTVQPRKNLKMLIKAFSDLVNSEKWLVHSQEKVKKTSTIHYALSTNHLTLVIAGKLGWNYDEILSAPKNFGVEKRVRFLKHIPNADLPALYSGAAVFAFPSLFEGFGLPILEAIACGCRVVASDIPAHREILNKILDGGPVSSFPPVNARSSLSSKLEDNRNAELRVVGNPSRTATPLRLSTNHYSLTTKLVPIILVKPTDVNKWANVLYQTISKGDKRVDSYNKKIEFEAKFSWLEAARQTRKVFSRVLG